jgi:polysaccharide export outer membrane protein
MRPVAAALSLLIVFGAGGQPAVAGDEPRLGVGDEITLQVHGRTDLSGHFVVRPSGDLVIPLIGKVRARGASLEETEREIEERLRAGLERDPIVTITDVEWRPVNVLGDVGDPKSVPYRPGMTVLAAVAAAGGFGRAGGAVEAEVGAIKSREYLETAIIRRYTLLADEARLVAEKTGAQTIAFDRVLSSNASDPRVAAIMDSAVQLKQLRDNELSTRLAALNQRIAISRFEVESLQQQLASLKRQQELQDEDLTSARDMLRRKLTSEPRVRQSEFSRLDTARLTAETNAYLARANGTLSELEQQLVSVPADRMREIEESLAKTRAELYATVAQIQSAADQVNANGRAVATASSGGSAVSKTTVLLLRDGVQTVVDATVPVLPGDTIDVPRPVVNTGG